MSYLQALGGTLIHGGPPLKGASRFYAATVTNNFCLGFRGDSGALNLSQPADLNFQSSSDTFTISAWFKVDVLDNQRCILAKANMNAGLISVFLGIQSDGTVYALVGGGNNTSGGNISDLGWHMITLVVTGGFATLYLDQSQVGTTFAVGSQKNVTADWLIGGSRYTDNTDVSYPWKGLIDEPTFWNTAFTQAQIAELYNSGVACNPTTHSKSANLLHWYRMGDDLVNDTIPTIKDQKASSNGTIINTSGCYLFSSAPGYVPSQLDDLSTGLSSDLQFNANSYSGSGNWSATIGSWTGVVSGTPTKAATSQFSGHSEIQNTSNGWFRLAANGSHAITASTTMTYVFRMKTGAEDGSGGFYAGYDAEGTATDWQVYNFFYAEDAASRMRNTNLTSNYLTAEQHGISNPNKYSTVHVVVNMPTTTLKVYVNGGLLINTSTTGGTLVAPATAPLGILGTAKFSAGGDVSTATGQAVMEVVRYRQVLTDDQIARQAAVFNSLKGYT